MGHDTQETTEDRRESDAVTNARNRVAEIAGTFGTDHPEYAAGLNQLALLLIMQGEPQAAEPLLRQSLDIRRRALGGLHPDYATNLSSLGGLLWARGDLDQAEPMLREALEVRTETLGPRHPKSVVSLNSLEQLLKAKRDGQSCGAPAASPPRPQEAVPLSARIAPPSAPAEGTVTPAPSGSEFAQSGDVPGAEQIASRLEQLGREFADLGGRLSGVGEQLRSGGMPPDDTLSAAWASARDGFARLRRDAVAAAEAHAVPVSSGGPASLADLTAWLPSLHAAEAARGEVESGRAEALRTLEGVDRLQCPGDPDFAPLAVCRGQAQGLRRAIEGAKAADLPDVSRPLTEGTHPLVTLLKLVAADDSTSDSEWADWYDAVGSAFGENLAVAIARSRIVAPAP